MFFGLSIGAEGKAVGEVVFNTAMTGYQEILTDPSYARQIITLTYPHIGNTGTNIEDFESDKVWSAGLVIRDLPLRTSSWRATQSLSEFLIEQDVVAISNIDTRALTRLIREKGALAGCILTGENLTEGEALAAARDFPGLIGMDLAKEVSCKETYQWSQSTWQIETGFVEPPEALYHVVAYDFGVKRNILRMLTERGCQVTVVPAQTPFEDAMAHKPDGIFLSNGPGDPDPCDYGIDAIRSFLGTDIPIFGICLGYQLLALASGAQSLKMGHGHHGANHPVKDLESGKVIITSQNHGFAVAEDTLPDCLQATHVSLFDGSLQGIRRTDRAAFGFQGHPEASPGPQDCDYLFDEFIVAMAEAAAELSCA